MNVIVTGSSGYVGSHLIPVLMEHQFEKIVGVDIKTGKFTTHVYDVGDSEFWESLDKSVPYIIINLAAARFDYGIDASVYNRLNVENTNDFLLNLQFFNIVHFIHISSVASFDGRNIPYEDTLHCDDAYRSTKFLQETLIQSFCAKSNIPCCTLYPSAIYDTSPRRDTNIGKLQSISKFLPFLPRIDVYKSLTHLPGLCDFIVHILNIRKHGQFMTVETPILTVSEIIRVTLGLNKKLFLPIPFLKHILYGLSLFFLIYGNVLSRDPKLIPSRVVKLFSDTSYNDFHTLFKLDVYKAFRRNNS